jgi:hypothetical protein
MVASVLFRLSEKSLAPRQARGQSESGSQRAGFRALMLRPGPKADQAGYASAPMHIGSPQVR